MLDAITYIMDLIVMRPDSKHPPAVRAIMWAFWVIALVALATGVIVLIAS